MDKIPVKDKIKEEKNFKISKMKEVVKPTQPHKHNNYFELIILFDGAGYHTIDTNTYDVNPPVAYFLNPGQVHCWQFTRVPKGYVILFKDEFLHGLNGIRNLIYEFPSRIDIQKEQELKFLLDSFQAEFDKPEANQEILKNYLNIILIKIHRKLGSKAVSFSKEMQIINGFKKLIEEYFTSSKSVPDYAAMLNINTAKLNKACKQSLGKNASELIKERIIQEANLKLTYTNNTVSEIAYQFNFSDPSNFVKFYKSFTNITPKHYRGLALKKLP